MYGARGAISDSFAPRASFPKPSLRVTRFVSPPRQVVGDDLLVTNPKRIATAIEKKACSALLLKVRGGGLASRARSPPARRGFSRARRVYHR